MAEPRKEVPRGHGWIMRELIGKLHVPRREQASVVSLQFYCTLAEPYALLLWAAPEAGRDWGVGTHWLQTKKEIGKVSV